MEGWLGWVDLCVCCSWDGIVNAVSPSPATSLRRWRVPTWTTWWPLMTTSWWTCQTRCSAHSILPPSTLLVISVCSHCSFGCCCWCVIFIDHGFHAKTVYAHHIKPAHRWLWHGTQWYEQANFKKIVMPLTCIWYIVFDSINWPGDLDFDLLTCK